MRDTRWGMAVALALLTLAVATPLVVRWIVEPREPAVEIVLPTGKARSVSLSEMRRLPTVMRRGEVQNQFGNWRDGGIYTGVRLTDLMGNAEYDALDVVAVDGYRVSIPRSRVESVDYPMVLAYTFDGVDVPAWQDGFRIAVLPEDGRVSNEEYGAVSAGSDWVKNVLRIEMRQGDAASVPTKEPEREG